MVVPCVLDDLAHVGLGYKSLQNQFFYLSKGSLSDHQIEDQFIVPIYRMKDLSARTFLQKTKPSQRLFHCNLDEADLRGTNALKYIRAMAQSPAARKKQSKERQTISEALSAQGGRYWYAPKAHPHEAHIWVRKAFDSVFGPALFMRPAILDQRCNFVVPRGAIHWKLLAAVLTSSLFALSAECQGAASMGAGALELPTKILRRLRIPDIRKLPSKDAHQLVTLAESVWKDESSTDWRRFEHPPKETVALDEFVLKSMGNPIGIQVLYRGVTEACRARFLLAQDKQTKEKAAVLHDIESVAETIASSVRPLIEGKQFPEAFVPPGCDRITFDLQGAPSLVVRAEPLMSETLVVVEDAKTERTILEKTFPREVADVFVRSLLLGRRHFAAPADINGARIALATFFTWIRSVLARIEEGCRGTAVGTRFEDQIRAKTMELLRIRPEFDHRELLGKFSLI